jgi:predicted PurR-regulated permease PerM
LVNGVLALFPVEKRGRVEEILQLIRVRVSGWIIGQIAAMALVFVLTWIGLAALGVEYAFTFAVLTGALEIVPFFGPILAAVPPTLAAFADSPTLALVVVIVYVAIHQIEAHVISPMVMARRALRQTSRVRSVPQGCRAARSGGRRPGQGRGRARGAENGLLFLKAN